MEEGRKKRKRNDVMLIVALLVIAGAFFAVTRGGILVGSASAADASGPYAVVQNTEGEYDVMPLSRDAEVTVVSSLGENRIKTSGGYVWIDEADCKNQICVQTGKVSRPGDTIVCLPHHLVVQVVNDPKDASPVAGLVDGRS